MGRSLKHLNKTEKEAVDKFIKSAKATFGKDLIKMEIFCSKIR